MFVDVSYTLDLYHTLLTAGAIRSIISLLKKGSVEFYYIKKCLQCKKLLWSVYWYAPNRSWLPSNLCIHLHTQKNRLEVRISLLASVKWNKLAFWLRNSSNNPFISPHIQGSMFFWQNMECSFLWGFFLILLISIFEMLPCLFGLCPIPIFWIQMSAGFWSINPSLEH